MNKLIAGLMVAGSIVMAAGCQTVLSARSPNTSSTGEAWYTTIVGLPNLPFSTHIYFCPKPAGPGPIQCKEAKYVEAGK